MNISGDKIDFFKMPTIPNFKNIFKTSEDNIKREEIFINNLDNLKY
tara:strand:+ start:267 stop:404 length:138 start_codon:yes stop_codon:yes gene_type:complete